MSVLNVGCARCILCLSLELGMLIIGILFWVNGTSQYGMAIKYETAEWSNGPVMDIVLQHNQTDCPQSYDRINSMFYGTDKVCKVNGIAKTAGKCQDAGVTENGMLSKKIEKLDGEYVCI
jgi:hypothetical protein